MNAKMLPTLGSGRAKKGPGATIEIATSAWTNLLGRVVAHHTPTATADSTNDAYSVRWLKRTAKTRTEHASVRRHAASVP